MTDKFICPAPSHAAFCAFDSVPLNGGYMDANKRRLAAAFAVDVPRLCREEVQRFISAAQRWTALEFNREADAYLASRFPEAAPEPCPHTKVWKPSGECVDCGAQTGAFIDDHLWIGDSTPTPSAPAEAKPTITVTPEVCGGAPCLAGTRLTTEVVAERAVAETVNDVARDYGISPTAVLAAVAFERDYGAPAVLGCDKCGNTLERNEEHPGYVKPCATCFPAAPPSEAPAKDAVERALASLGKAYPYLVKHADHIDGEFSNALAEVRRMLGVAAARPEAEPVSEALRDMVGRSLRPCTACGCERCSNERAFVRELAFVFGNNMPFAYTESGDENVRVGHNHDVAIAARKIRP